MSSRSDKTLIEALIPDVSLIIGYIASAVRPDKQVWPIGDDSHQ